MSKPKTVPVPGAEQNTNTAHHSSSEKAIPEPLSGSKDTKGKNHSRDNHGEGK